MKLTLNMKMMRTHWDYSSSSWTGGWQIASFQAPHYLQYVCTVRSGRLVQSMVSCGQRVDIRGAGFDWYNSQTWHWSVPSVPKKKKAVLTLPCEWSGLQSLGSHFTRKVSRFDRWGTPPRVSTLCLPDVTTRNKISPCVFTYWKWFNTGSGQILIREVPGQRDRGTEGQRQRDRDRGTRTGTGYRNMGTRLRLWSLPC